VRWKMENLDLDIEKLRNAVSRGEICFSTSMFLKRCK
jgi:hypothetical protein